MGKSMSILRAVCIVSITSSGTLGSLETLAGVMVAEDGYAAKRNA